MLDAIKLAERSFNLEYHVKKWEWALISVQGKSQAASSAAFSAQHSALAIVEDVSKCFEELKYAKKRLKLLRLPRARCFMTLKD